MAKIPSVDAYITAHPDWADALKQLRNLLLGTELEETIKWGMPVYALDGKNVVGTGAFKNWCGLWFFNGSFLSDPEHKLINAQEGKTRALRQWRFTDIKLINSEADLIRSYVIEAIENQRAGKFISPEKCKSEPPLPAILNLALDEDPTLKLAWSALTPGRQREYAEHIGGAKREQTRVTRLKKATPLILQGKGLNDRWR